MLFVALDPTHVQTAMNRTLTLAGEIGMSEGKKKEENNEKRLMENAIDSISLGVEDFHSKDSRRVISAIRNTYAGVLLLCKQVLWNASPEGSNGSLIYNDLKLQMVNGKGLLVPKNIYGNTLNRAKIQTRFKELDYKLNWKKFEKLAIVRNQVEHLFIEKDPKFAKEALALAMPIIVELLELLEVDPSVEFDMNTWNELLENQEVFDALYEICQKTFDKVEWSSEVLKRSLPFARCKICKSSLIRQKDEENTKSKSIELRCSGCGKFQSKKKVFEKAIDSLFQISIDSDDELENVEYIEATMCPYCGYRGWVDNENLCVLCEADVVQCSRCGESFRPSELNEDSICIGCIEFRRQMGKND